jgi:hypothetical protein
LCKNIIAIKCPLTTTIIANVARNPATPAKKTNVKRKKKNAVKKKNVTKK